MELMYATCSLSLTTAKKLAGQHTNGDVEEAMTAADSAKEAYVDFVRDEAAHQFSKSLIPGTSRKFERSTYHEKS